MEVSGSPSHSYSVDRKVVSPGDFTPREVSAVHIKVCGKGSDLLRSTKSKATGLALWNYSV